MNRHGGACTRGRGAHVGAARIAALAACAGAACAGDIVIDDREPAATPDAAAVTEPENCHDWLDLHGIDYSPASETPGVAEPVTVYTPIAGIHYRASWQEDRRESLFMDCELARSLTRAAEYLRAHDIVEVADMGIYNYRCIGGGNPDDGCPNGISQHAYALAIDIAGFTTEDGAYASVNDDWVIDPDGVETCAAEATGDKNALLHELICELKEDGVWNIVLTPNYNAAHRDHFHVDLTEGSDFIKARDDGVDVAPPAH